MKHAPPLQCLREFVGFPVPGPAARAGMLRTFSTCRKLLTIDSCIPYSGPLPLAPELFFNDDCTFRSCRILQGRLMITMPLPLQAGPLSLILDHGMIRSVRFGDIEIVRRVYMALRDRHWNTVPFSIGESTLERSGDSFEVSFDAVHDVPGILFEWHGIIRGGADGTVSLAMRGKAKNDFSRNRIGWCVLHPLALCKNARCKVVKPDGSFEFTRFPGDEIAPRQPITGITAMTYAVVPGLDCTLRFSGDTFETEDQRNWTDASFKTYSTPLSLPIPVEVTAGTTLEQRVAIFVEGSARPGRRRAPKPELDAGRLSPLSRPPLGVGLCHTGGGELAERVLNNLSLPGLSHLRFEVTPAVISPHADYSLMKSICERIGCGIELAAHLSSDYSAELAILASEADEARPAIHRVLVLRTDRPVTSADTAEEAARLFDTLLPAGGLAIGTDRYFVEINRAAPIAARFDALCFSANPQVHTFDDRAVMENLEGLKECINAAGTLSGGKPIVLSPLTLRPRRDPLRPEKSGGDDPRQREQFGAAWFLGVMDACIRSGLHSLTCFNVTGPGGVMSENGTELYPVYHILSSGILSASALESLTIRTNGTIFTAVKAESREGRVMLLGNLGERTGTIAVDLRGHREFTLGCLESSTPSVERSDPLFWENAGRRVSSPASGKLMLELAPYSVIRMLLTGTGPY